MKTISQMETDAIIISVNQDKENVAAHNNNTIRRDKEKTFEQAIDDSHSTAIVTTTATLPHFATLQAIAASNSNNDKPPDKLLQCDEPEIRLIPDMPAQPPTFIICDEESDSQKTNAVVAQQQQPKENVAAVVTNSSLHRTVAEIVISDEES